MERLEDRQLLSLTLANPLADIVVAPGAPPTSIDLSQVFDDTQTAV